MPLARLPRSDCRWRPPQRRGPNLRSASSLVAARGPLRRVLAALAGRFVAARGWERLGFARTRDYAVERLGLSARALQDLARVDAQLARLPAVEAALVAGALTWTKVRLVCRVAQPVDEARWIALAGRLTARRLAHEVRAVDVGAVESIGNETDEDGASDEPRECVRIRCTPFVRARWWSTRQLARRAAGEALPVWQAMENVAAEVLSAFPLEVSVETTDGAPSVVRAASARPANGCAAQPIGAEPRPSGPASVPPFLASLLDGLDAADAFELDARLRRAVALEQRLESQLGEHLLAVPGTPRSLAVYAREQLGISPRKARGLLRMARVAATHPALHAAWAAGRLSWVQAQAILPLLVERPEEAARWIEHAASVSVRRLEDDMEARERQRGAQPTGSEADPCEVFWLAPADVARLFRATLCSVRRRIERASGRLPTEGEAFGAMLDHAFLAWGGDEQRVRAAWRVFARDGWRCTVPGCSSYRNLHDHHIRFRSAGGSDDEANRTTLCAWHHLRGVHAGRVRVGGRAPGGLRFELGLRAGCPPLLSYGTGA